MFACTKHCQSIFDVCFVVIFSSLFLLLFWSFWLQNCIIMTGLFASVFQTIPVNSYKNEEEIYPLAYLIFLKKIIFSCRWTQ